MFKVHLKLFLLLLLLLLLMRVQKKKEENDDNSHGGEGQAEGRFEPHSPTAVAGHISYFSANVTLTNSCFNCYNYQYYQQYTITICRCAYS